MSIKASIDARREPVGLWTPAISILDKRKNTRFDNPQLIVRDYRLALFSDHLLYEGVSSIGQPQFSNPIASGT